MTGWGVVSTIRAPLDDCLDFAAWHLELGARHLFLYLDDHAPDALRILSRHPAITVQHTDAGWWAKRGGRPETHQRRQCRNARHAYGRAKELAWLTHIDVDEFLIPSRPVAETLAGLPARCLCARIRPMEALAPGSAGAPGQTLFKALELDHARRRKAARACFPTWGRHLSGGFLSHVAGKLFFRTGLGALKIRIHNVTLDGADNPGQIELTDPALGHFHASDWGRFRAALPFRLAQGSYRAALRPAHRGKDAQSLHTLLCGITSSDGEAGLRAFFDEICVADDALCARLSDHGLLRRHPMGLGALRRRHFPGH